MARRLVRYLNGAKLLAPNGSLVFCENCEKIGGCINKSSYGYIKFVFICTCGLCGSVELIRNGRKPGSLTNRVDKMPKIVNHVCTCCNCDRALLSVAEASVQNYSFFAECVCGEQFDTKPTFDKRLGETMKVYEQIKNK